MLQIYQNKYLGMWVTHKPDECNKKYDVPVANQSNVEKKKNKKRWILTRQR